jgi:predicted lipoprotein with Yx(FWY)xxD motif
MQHLRLHRGLRGVAVGALMAVALGACGAPATQQASPAATDAATVQVVESDLGQILADARGFTLYAFDKDEATKPQSTRNGDCAVTWPPLVAEGSPTGDGIDAALLGSAPREDGTTQVNMNSWPLYTFSGDQAPGDTNGQGVGGVWHVIGIDGKPIRDEAAAATEATSGATIQVTDSPLGQILVDAEGRTLYAFDPDQGEPRSTCEGNCAVTWPPLVVEENLVTSDGIDQSLIDLAPRNDGAVQVRVNNWPLYTFSGDQAPGETNGQGVGGVWHVVGIDGKPIRDGAGAPAAPAAPADNGSYSY